ncbi:MAG: hypothetical protein WCK58_18135, partial [Chloroflexota bacterium]
MLVPMVPVTGFWSTEHSISRTALAAALAGTGASPRRVYAAAEDLPSLAAFLGVTPGANVRALAPADVRAHVAASPSSLGIVRAEDVGPKVQALAVGGVSLFGGSRARSLDAWPLLVPEAATARPSTFNPAVVWTIAAGGDVNLERSVYRKAVLEKRGPGYPWNGGFARVTSRYCCGVPGMTIMRAATVSGTRGAVRTLLRRADIALVNLEGPAPDNHTFHADGFTFTIDPA